LQNERPFTRNAIILPNLKSRSRRKSKKRRVNDIVYLFKK